MTVQASSGNNKRIAKNTLLLYFRMIFMMAVSLYTSRVVLNTLGVEDFGIYNVIGGVVAMFSVISGGLSAAISRYITFELGQGNTAKLKSVFSSSVTIQIGLALLIFVLAEIGGVWFLNEKMNLPESRIGAANWVLQCSILTFMVNLISVPYNAAIIAHERMQAFAYISIIEVVLKLLIVYILVIFSFDKLKLYGILLLAVACVIRIAYGIYCKRNFKECTYHFTFNKALLKEMMGFAGWNFIGAFAGVLRDQGVNIVINLFCGPVINAARAIAFQVNVAVNGFATNFMTAINPQITKSYASGDYLYMLTLVQSGARFSFYLLLLLSLPIIIETNTILTLWLKNVPEYTVIFVRLVLVFAMCEVLSGTQITALQATGNIRNYQIVVGSLQLLNLPIAGQRLCTRDDHVRSHLPLFGMPLRPPLVSSPAGGNIHKVLLYPSAVECLRSGCSGSNLPYNSLSPDECRHFAVIRSFRRMCHRNFDRHLLCRTVGAGADFRAEKNSSQNQTEMFCIKV